MATSFGALCTDFYVNQKVSLKMDLPSARETVLDLFDRVRRELPAMDRFRRYDGELALESAEQDAEYCWLALRRTSIRSGWVNPQGVDQAYRLHRMVLDVAPYFLSISPLDVEHIELVYGFDIEVGANRNEVVFDALWSQSPLTRLVDEERESVLDAQPFLGFSLDRSKQLQAFVEVKTRSRPPEAAANGPDHDPVSVYLTVRRSGPLRSVEELGTTFGTLAGHVERLAEERIVPHVVVPIRQMYLSRPG
ncbi:MAG: hypothetical protein ACYTGG_04170 [Planctomycetota bacterium]|jgi:hypothetical protein